MSTDEDTDTYSKVPVFAPCVLTSIQGQSFIDLRDSILEVSEDVLSVRDVGDVRFHAPNSQSRSFGASMWGKLSTVILTELTFPVPGPSQSQSFGPPGHTYHWSWRLYHNYQPQH